MGEIPGSVARQMRDQYMRAYEETERKIRTNFEDMDLENAMLRDDLEVLVEEAGQACEDGKVGAGGLSFL